MKCSFCEKTKGKREVILAGPAGVYICSDCVTTCFNVLMKKTYLAINLVKMEPKQFPKEAKKSETK